MLALSFPSRAYIPDKLKPTATFFVAIQGSQVKSGLAISEDGFRLAFHLEIDTANHSLTVDGQDPQPFCKLCLYAAYAAGGAQQSHDVLPLQPAR